MKNIFVLLVDDHPIFRDGVKSLFTDEEEITIIDVAGEANEALQKTKQYKPEVILLDISLPGISGIDLISKFREINSAIKIIILSMHTDEDYIFKAIRSGANGYLSKQNTNKSELIKAIEAVIDGKEYYGDMVEKIMQKHFLQEARGESTLAHDLYESLSQREKEILKMVVEGMSNPEIAAKLFVNIRTVETHKFNILQKLKLKSMVELVKFAIKNHLLEL